MISQYYLQAKDRNVHQIEDLLNAIDLLDFTRHTYEIHHRKKNK